MLTVRLQILLMITLVLCIGCQPTVQERSASVSPEKLTALRSQLVGTEAPELTLSIPRVRQKLSPKDAIEGEPEPEPPPATVEVSVRGRICEQKSTADNPDFPWQQGRAAFMMIDPSFTPSEHEGHGEGDECPFCQKKEQDAQALVQFRAADGEIVQVDARELFDISAGQEVVVTGTASLLADILMIDATSLLADEASDQEVVEVAEAP